MEQFALVTSFTGFRPLITELWLSLDLAELAVDGGYFLDPVAAVGVFQLHDVALGPVEVVRYEGYLPQELVQGVADYPPRPTSSGTNSSLQ